MEMTQENIEAVVARMDERLTQISKDIGHLTEFASQFVTTEQKAAQAKEQADNAFTEINKLKSSSEATTGFMSEIRGGMRVGLWIITLLNGVLVAFLIWLATSVMGLRERTSVLEYRLQVLEKPRATP